MNHHDINAAVFLYKNGAGLKRIIKQLGLCVYPAQLSRELKKHITLNPEKQRAISVRHRVENGHYKLHARSNYAEHVYAWRRNGVYNRAKERARIRSEKEQYANLFGETLHNLRARKKWNNRYVKERLCPVCIMKRSIRKVAWRMASAGGYRKGRDIKSVQLLGCTYDEARRHIESQFRDGMTWSNYGKVWEIDHIRPISSFDLSDPSQRMMAANFCNLQPLLVAENRAKSASWPHGLALSA